MTWYDRIGIGLVAFSLSVPLALVAALVVTTFLRGPTP